jgi:GTPase SAR1 family protein
MKITKGKQTRPQRVVIYGVESVGKTTFAAQFPTPLYLDIEGGTAHLDTDRVEINSWAELNGAIKEVVNTDYQTVIIDSADWAERLCVEDLLATTKKSSRVKSS